MHLIRRAVRGATALATVAALAACENETPTVTGPELFPEGLSPTTIQAEFGGVDLLLRQDSYSGFGDPRFAPFLLVANSFDGVLDAHAILRINVPDSVTYSVAGSSRREEVQDYRSGTITVVVDSLAAAPVLTTRLLLWELGQPWDSATVTWENASAGDDGAVPWTTPGGTPGRLISDNFWIPGSETQNDSITLSVDASTITRMREPEHPGFMVTTDRVDARVKLSSLSFAAEVVPAGTPDTMVDLQVENVLRQFIYSPQATLDAETLQTGGFRGDRSIVVIDLDQEVEACPAVGGPCAMVPLRNVTVNRAQLVLEPISVLGHRPLADPTVQLRRVSEPDLGRFAPLGPVLGQDSIGAGAFAPGAEREFTIDITATLLQRLNEQRAAAARGEGGSYELAFAILTSHSVPDLGLLRFRRSPRLRVLYTLPLNPALP